MKKCYKLGMGVLCVCSGLALLLLMHHGHPRAVGCCSTTTTQPMTFFTIVSKPVNYGVSTR